MSQWNMRPASAARRVGDRAGLLAVGAQQRDVGVRPSLVPYRRTGIEGAAEVEPQHAVVGVMRAVTAVVGDRPECSLVSGS